MPQTLDACIQMRRFSEEHLTNMSIAFWIPASDIVCAIQYVIACISAVHLARNVEKIDEFCNLFL